MEPGFIVIRGAQQHNLKHIDLAIPRNKLVVLTGVSGSGKSSLAFDTIYAEGQRRYVESLSSFARQFLGQMEKPKVDFIGGLSPAIAIQQKAVSKNPRSTVGTVTEVMDYLRVLFARVGEAHCPQCGRKVASQNAQQIADQLAALPSGTRFQLLAPVVRQRKGTHEDVLAQARQEGYERARIDGVPTDLSRDIKLAKTKNHTIELIVDRLAVPNHVNGSGDEAWRDFTTRLMDSVETALRAGEGTVVVDVVDGEELLLSEQHACPHCGISFPELSPQLFSFNSPLGMCPECNGLGTKLEVDPALIVQDPTLSVLDGALRWYGNLRKKNSQWQIHQLQSIARHYGVDLETPWQDLPQHFRDVLIYGSGNEKIHFEYRAENGDSTWTGESYRPAKGIIYNINRLFHQTKSDYTRRWYSSFMSEQPCPVCGGARLRPEARGVLVGGKSIMDVSAMPIDAAHAWVQSLYEQFDDEQFAIGGEVLKEIRDRLQFMLNVGLHYLTLDRPAPSLSGGESQRIRLASQIGCGLVGVLYILDEPSIGLHARDNRALLDTLLQLRDMGNTVLVVEHDRETMLDADWIVDLGPGAGVLGGCVIAEGTPQEIATNPQSLTGRYLSGELAVVSPNGGRRTPQNGSLILRGATLHNLKHVDARFPLGVFTCVTGVSGSGKSSLVAETLYPALARDLNRAETRPGPYERLEGLEHLDKVIDITQDPIGRTPRSNPATYVGVFDEIRQVFASTPEAKMRGYGSGRFSFNVKGGRCEACKGHGLRRIEMHFLPDVWVTCKECKGTRFNRETLQIRYKGKNIAEVLDMDVQEALDFFANHPRLSRQLQTLHDVGLDYIKLGQAATTLSGGEAQRVKLAKELSRVATGRTVYILDEPTTGLHFADIQKLLDVLHRLTDAGNTVIVIEHNLDVIKTADWVIDLGPEGGDAGGYIIAEGPPEAVAQVEGSYTGQFLRQVLAPVPV
ncbi:MAG TPA: excinuclease ABC subunit UvrA [Anaerolineae bacterium]|nr:excinuclease ABC subunit UvrA [Anaerolineae bacterium]HQK14013.1 excinuclease ABC subunit UvrA [Anaerolineae bacterium]